MHPSAGSHPATAAASVFDFSAAPRAHLRPRGVVPVIGPATEHSLALNDADLGLLRLPTHLSRRARAVGVAIANIATRRLTDGWPLAVALRSAALGRDELGRQLRVNGIPMDRKTVAYCLAELTCAGVITRVGQLGAWTDPDEQDGSRVIKSGAYLYALAVEVRELGSLALTALRSSATSWGNRTRKRSEGALKWAVEHARPGERNVIGFWLACRCGDAGLTEGEADRLMRRYVAAVDQSGHRYDLGEAGRTLASVYRTRVVG